MASKHATQHIKRCTKLRSSNEAASKPHLPCYAEAHGHQLPVDQCGTKPHRPQSFFCLPVRICTPGPITTLSPIRMGPQSKNVQLKLQ
jgi:hypothetical protein